jgi:hypothetical protein
MFTKFVFMLLFTANTPEQTTWVWPEAYTYPEERQVIASYPVLPVEQHVIEKIIIPLPKPKLN